MPPGEDPSMGFTPGQAPPEDSGGAGFWAVFKGDTVLVRTGDDESLLPRVENQQDLGIELKNIHYVGELGGAPCFAARTGDKAEPPDGCAFVQHRAIFTRVPAAMYRAMGAARQILDWDRKNRFCGSCGKPMENKPGERARFCPGLQHRALSPGIAGGDHAHNPWARDSSGAPVLLAPGHVQRAGRVCGAGRKRRRSRGQGGARGGRDRDQGCALFRFPALGPCPTRSCWASLPNTPRAN